VRTRQWLAAKGGVLGGDIGPKSGEKEDNFPSYYGQGAKETETGEKFHWSTPSKKENRAQCKLNWKRAQNKQKINSKKKFLRTFRLE